MRSGCGAVAALVALLSLAGWSGRAAAQEMGVLAGYGYVKQDRMGFGSEGHLLSIGIHTVDSMLESGIFASATIDFVIDHEYTDLTQLAVTIEGAYAWGGDVFNGYAGMALRCGVDGYPDSSWSPLDPGAVVGFIVLMGPLGLGAEFRGWLGWDVYQDVTNRIEPYFDARAYMSVLL
jgi:hypothetical protein